jgi:thiol-disulfide isomerase/thioredoxin
VPRLFHPEEYAVCWNLQRSIVGLAAAALLVAANAPAGDKDKKDGKASGVAKDLKVIEGMLAATDPIDKMTKRPSKTHKVVLAADKLYRIDMQSADFDAFLRLENAAGQQLAFNDDGGDALNARLVQKIDAAGEYSIVATSHDGKAGKYTITVSLAEPRDIWVAKLQELPKLAAAERQSVLAEAKKELTQNPGKVDRGLANTLLGFAVNLESAGKRDEANAVYADFGPTLAAATDPDVAGMGKMMQGALRRAKLMNNAMVVYGRTLDGKGFDWKAYRGKVVLVDFWATGSAACRAELPNLKKLYQAYNKRGFEVVAVNIDGSKHIPVKYVEKEKLPWVCLFDAQPGKGLESLRQYYGVFAIPQAILVDRAGQVVSMNARGPELERLLEKQLGPSAKGDK